MAAPAEGMNFNLVLEALGLRFAVNAVEFQKEINCHAIILS
jgi:hypothetical protein